MYTKSLSSLLIIVLVVFSFQVQVARAEVIVDLVEDVATFITDVVVNIVIQAIDITAIVVLGTIGGTIDALCIVATLGDTCGATDFLVDPFVTDFGCRPGFGSSPGGLGLECGDGGSQISGGGNLINLSSTLSSTSASPTCSKLTLSGINPQGHNYAILRDGIVVKQLTAADTSFTDTGLTPHTDYSYVVRLPDPAEAGFKTADSAPLEAYTKCLPQCGFGVDSSSVATFSSTNLRWKCLYNDPTADTGSCKIVDSNNVSQTVNALSGSLQIFPAADTTYTLTCTNIDGPISIPQSVSIFKPGIKEVRP